MNADLQLYKPASFRFHAVVGVIFVIKYKGLAQSGVMRRDWERPLSGFDPTFSAIYKQKPAANSSISQPHQKSRASPLAVTPTLVYLKAGPS